MFYVSSYRGNLIGVTDSEDNMEEFYTRNFLNSLDIDIIRFNKELEIDYTFTTDCFKFTLVKINGILGWKLSANSECDSFKNNSYYFGYPVTSLFYSLAGKTPNL